MATTYTPSTNLDPTQATFGQSSGGVAAYQASLNQQNYGKPGYVPLAVDGKYGPLTQAASQFGKSNPGIVSSSQARNDLATYGSQLDDINSDPYLEALNKSAMTLQERVASGGTPGVGEKNASVEGGRLAQKTQDDFEKYKAGLETLGIQTGLSRYAPGLQADKLINAANSETEKLQEIQTKEDLAIAKAKDARQRNDAESLKSTLAEIRSIRSDKRQAIQDQLSTTSKEFSIGAQHAAALYGAYKNIAPAEQEAFILKAANELGISNPKNLIDAIVAYHNKQSSGGGGHYTATNIPSSVAKDLQATLKNNPDRALTDFYGAFPEVSTSYISSLYRTYHPTSAVSNPFQ